MVNLYKCEKCGKVSDNYDEIQQCEERMDSMKYPAILKNGSLYKLRDRDGYVLEVMRRVHTDPYSQYTYRVRSVITGWTMTIHGVNQYEDGSIDWVFSTDGYYTRKED